jgi:hypothetical protein
MTSPTPLVASVDPGSMLVSSPNEYQAVVLTVTISNPSSTSPYDVSNGLTIVIPVDPGGSGSPAALLLSSASGNGGGTAQPTLTVPITNVVMPPGWEYVVPVPGTYRALPPGDSAVLAANGSLQFAFSPVVADFASGSANITVSVPVATTGTALNLTVPIIKLPAPLSATLEAGTPALTMPDNTTDLSWQVLGADTCELTWTPSTTVVTYNGEPCPNPWSNPPFQFSEGAFLPVATVYQNTSFTLTANGQSKEDTATAEVTLATPTLIALTIPPLVTGVSPASGDPGGGQQVTITGTGLYGTSTIVSVTFGDASATVLTVDPDGSSITATTPPGTAGSNVPVSVITQTGASVATPAASYTYAPAGVPVVTSMDPPGGDPAGGQQVTITGTGLAGATAVTFGSASATPFTVNADGSMTATVPPATLSAGTNTSIVAVTVTTPAGSSPPTPGASYTYAATGVPVVCGVTQAGAGSPYGGQPVTITGINFSGATSVGFGSAGLTLTDNNPDPDGTTITVTAPAADPSDISHGTPCTTIDVTVTVAGDTTSPLTSAINAADKYTYANTPPSPPAPPDQPSSPSVSPCQPFNLIWSCYTNTTLNWSMIQAAPGVTDTVAVTGLASGSVSNGGKIMPSDTAVVTITAPTTFTPQVALPGPPAPTPVSLGVDAVALSDFSFGVPVVDPKDGNQSVTLTWTAQNASSFSLTGGEVNEPSLPYDQRSYLVTSLSLSAPTEFTLTAIGFDGSGAYAPLCQTVTVVPQAVEVTITTSPVQAQVSDPAQGTQTAIVEWQALNATSVTITGGAQTLYPGIHDTSASVELPFPPPSSGPASYLITIQAGGYVPPDVPDSGTVTVIPTAVAITSFTASPGADYRYPNNPGEPVALNWAVTAPTGLILSFDEVAGPPLPPETTPPTYNPGPESTATYTLTAQGYPAAAQLPSKTVTVYVKPVKVPGIKESGAQLEKNPPDYPKIVSTPGTVPGPGDLTDPDPTPPGGTEQAFIGPDERPDVGAPGARGPHPPAAGEA